MLGDDYINKLRRKLFDADKNDDLLNLLLVCERITRYYKGKEIEKGADYAKDMYRIGTVYLNTGRCEKAIGILNKADTAVKQNPALEGIRVDILNNLSIAYINNNEVEKAYKGFKEALRIKKLINGEDGEQYINLLCNIGSALFDREDYDKAIYYHFEALNKRSARDIFFADNLNFLGYDFEAKGETENAVSYFEQAAAVIKAVKGAASNDYIANVYYLAGVLERDEQFERALKYYETVAEKFKETGREEHPYYAEALGKMSGVCVKLGNYQRALILCLKAMAIVKKSMGVNHIYYAGSIKSAADIYLKTGDFKRAVELYEKEVELKKKLLGEKNDVSVKAVIHLCDVYIKSGDLIRAQGVCRDLLKVIDSSNPLYFDVLMCLVRIYTVQENAELLYMVYETAKMIEPKFSFDDMLKRAFEEDTAENVFKRGENDRQNAVSQKNKNCGQEVYEQESFDSFFNRKEDGDEE